MRTRLLLLFTLSALYPVAAAGFQACTRHFPEKLVTPSFDVLVTDRDQPVRGLEVEIQSYEADFDGKEDVVLKAWTDTNGKVRVRNLPPGSYWILIGQDSVFSSRNRLKVTQKSVERASSTVRFEWIEEKMVVRVRELEGVLVELGSRGQSGVPRALLVVRDARTGAEVARRETGEDGTFSIRGLPPRIYAVDVYEPVRQPALSELTPEASGTMALEVSADADTVDGPIRISVWFATCGLDYTAEPLNDASQAP